MFGHCFVVLGVGNRPESVLASARQAANPACGLVGFPRDPDNAIIVHHGRTGQLGGEGGREARSNVD